MTGAWLCGWALPARAAADEPCAASLLPGSPNAAEVKYRRARQVPPGPPAAERRWSLFNVKDDYIEQHDLSATTPGKYAEMQQAWERYDQENGVIY